jgi:hypothetical protein
MKSIMPEENQPKLSPELPGTVPQNAEPSFDVPQTSVEFRTMPKDAEKFGKVPQVAERKEDHTLTVREVARMFESAGVARTERSITNWCQTNRQGIRRLDCYYDPNEHKYYITPQSVEAAIQEEIQRQKKSPEAADSETFGNHAEPVKRPHTSTSMADERRIQDLEREVQNLEIANQVREKFINLLKNERAGFIEKLQTANRTIGQLETKLHQLDGPTN